MSDKNNVRLRYAAVCFVVIVVECLIALYVRDDFIRPYIGDMLVVVPIYCLFRIAVPEGGAFTLLSVFFFLCDSRRGGPVFSTGGPVAAVPISAFPYPFGGYF